MSPCHMSLRSSIPIIVLLRHGVNCGLSGGNPFIHLILLLQNLNITLQSKIIPVNLIILSQNQGTCSRLSIQSFFFTSILVSNGRRKLYFFLLSVDFKWVFLSLYSWSRQFYTERFEVCYKLGSEIS